MLEMQSIQMLSMMNSVLGWTYLNMCCNFSTTLAVNISNRLNYLY